MIKRIEKWDSYHYNAFGYNIISLGEIKTWTLKLIKTKPRFTHIHISGNFVNCVLAGSISLISRFKDAIASI